MSRIISASILAALALQATPLYANPNASALFIDASALETQLSAQVDLSPMNWNAFEPTAIAESFLRTEDSLTRRGTLANRRVYLSGAEWWVELNSEKGSFVAERQESTSNAAGSLEALSLLPVANREDVQADAVNRLLDWGIPHEEAGMILPRAINVAGVSEDGEVTEDLLHSHKIFAFRAIDGIRVEGHRAVLTYNRDGSFQRARVHWPVLAAEGHRLRTELSTQEIVERARLAISRTGAPLEVASVQLTFEPNLNTEGEVTLTLKAQASFDELSNNQIGERIVVDVDVNAIR